MYNKLSEDRTNSIRINICDPFSIFLSLFTMDGVGQINDTVGTYAV